MTGTTTSLVESVRATCKKAAESAGFISINTDRIASYAAGLPSEAVNFTEHDADAHFLGQGADTVAFFLTLDSVNFGSGYFPFLSKRPGMSGYFTVATCLADHFRAYGPIPAAELAGMTAERAAIVFRQDLVHEGRRELMNLFAAALRDLGLFVTERFGGSFTSVVEEAGKSADRLARLLAEMPFYRDEEDYRDFRVAFYKRAQIASQDLALAFGNTEWGEFHDLDRLTIFADNLVPHVLRVDGILCYDEDLARRIDAEELIPAGSPEEVEIRACAVHAVELMADALRQTNALLAPREIDFLLWNRGQLPFYKKGKPRHRTRSVFY